MRSLLDDIFSKDEEDIETFMMAASDSIKLALRDKGLEDDEDVNKVLSGKGDSYKAPSLMRQQSGFIEITHGWHDEDYVWHISAWHQKKQWNVDQSMVIYAVAKAMNSCVPTACKVNIFPPYQQWEIKEYTFKAIDLGSYWQINQAMLNELTDRLFVVLNELV